MSKRKYSFIWLYFEEEEGKKAKCKFCKKSLSFSGGCHGNLNRHLKLKHSLTNLNFEKFEPTSAEIIKFEQPLDEKPSTSTQIATVSKQHQITQLFSQPLPEERLDVEHIDRLLLKMIVKGHHSFRLVEEPDFINLINEVSNCPGYTLPSKKMLSKSLLPTIHMELLEDIKEDILFATDICLTVDRWTTRTNAFYVAVSAHYINMDTVLVSQLLESGEYENTNTLCTFLKNVMSVFQINNKITAIVSDNTPNIVAAISQGGWLGINCFAHSLNSAIQPTTAEIIKTVNKVRKVVQHFAKSVHDLDELQATRRQINLPEIALKQDDPTRWTSTYEMLHKMNQIQDAVISILSLKNTNIMLTIEDWEIVAETVSVLDPFYQIIVEISGEKNITLSKVTVICKLLEDHMNKCSPLNKKVIKMVTNLRSALSSVFKNLEKEYLYAECTILDPRFKRKGFKNDDSYEQALKSLRNKICTIRLPNEDENSLARITNGPEYESSIWQEYDREFKRMKLDNDAACNLELDKYLNEDYLDRKKDPLMWWKERKCIYPRVYLYAVKRLCIVANSVPFERIFTAAGQVITERRTLLKSNKVEGQVFLHNNM